MHNGSTEWIVIESFLDIIEDVFHLFRFGSSLALPLVRSIRTRYGRLFVLSFLIFFSVKSRSTRIKLNVDQAIHFSAQNWQRVLSSSLGQQRQLYFTIIEAVWTFSHVISKTIPRSSGPC